MRGWESVGEGGASSACNLAERRGGCWVSGDGRGVLP
jgi:hypothetical protein